MPNLSEQGFLLAAGKALEYSYNEAPDAGGPVIVLLHEGLGCCGMWKDFSQRLASACSLSVFSYSRAGYGRSESKGLPWPVSYMHDEALETLPSMLAAGGITDAILVGHSDGASIAAIHAGGIQPDNVRALVLMAPHFFAEDVSVASITKARTAYEKDDLRRGLERYHGINTDEAFHGWSGAWLEPAFRDWNIAGYLKDINVPVLGLQGRDDEYGTAAQLEAVRQNRKAPAETVLIDNCGHSPHRDQPDMTTNLIANFIAQL